MKDGGKADFGVEDTIESHVFEEFEGDSFETLSGLHDGDGVGEAFEVLGEVSALGTAMKPPGEFGGIGSRKAFVLQLASEVDDCSWADSTIEMFVEEDFGEFLEVDDFVSLHRMKIAVD